MVFALHCLALLPFLCLFLTIACFRTRGDWLYAIIRGSLLWGTLIYIQVNVLSLFTAITFTPVLAFWILWFAIALIWLWPRRGSLQWVLPKGRMMLGLYLIAGLTLLTGLLYPPNNWDAMTYNMPRVMHWMQNQSLEPWPTSIDRQIGMAPLASFFVLQTYLLDGTDRLANMPQWLAWLGSLCLIWGICRQIGGNRTACCAAVAFMGTLPMGILQASNAECSLVVTFYLCCFFSLLLHWKDESDFIKATWIGLAVGLAILSKGSAYPLGFAAVVAMGLLCLRRLRLMPQGVLAACIIVFLLVPHSVRVYQAYGSIIASAEGNVIGRITPSTFAANASSHFLMNLPLWSSQAFREGYAGLLQSIGIEMEDTSIYPWGNPRDNTQRFYTTEDSRAQNPLHALALLVLLIFWAARRSQLPFFYSSVVIGTFVSFCLMLSWFPYITRIHLTLYAFAAPGVGLAFAAISHKRLQKALLIIFFLGALPALFLNVNRPLVPQEVIQTLWLRDTRDCWRNPREELYFNPRWDIREEYIACAEEIARHKPKAIGLRLGSDGWEYPLWVLLNNLKYYPIIGHVSIKEVYKNDRIIFELFESNENKTTPKLVHIDSIF